MRIVAASDLHLDEQHRTTFLRAAEEADLCLLAGDYAQRREGLAEYVAAFDGLAGKALIIAGNNETVEELRAASALPVLHGNSVTFGGLTISGLGGATPPLPQLPWGSFDLTEEQAADQLAQIPAADVLITHSPPRGLGDWHHQVGEIGSTSVRDAIERLQPQLALCGHVHDSWGARGHIGRTLVANLGPVPVVFEVTQ